MIPVRAIVMGCFGALFILGFFLNRGEELIDTLTLEEIESLDGTEVDSETMTNLMSQVNVQDVYEEDDNEYLLELINGHEIKVRVAA